MKKSDKSYKNGKYPGGIPKPHIIKDDDLLRQDGWGNIVRSMGSRLQRAADLSSSQTWVRMPFETCENFYSTNTLARKVVRLILDYGLLNGWRFSFNDTDREETLKLETEIREKIEEPMNIVEETKKAIEWGRLYGSAYLLGNFEDGRHPSEPLDEMNIKGIEWIQALTPFELFPFRKDYNFGAGTYLEPEYYTFIGYGGFTDYMGLQIHRSRIIRFDGIYLPRKIYIANGYINNSVLQPVYDVFQDYALALEACGYAIREYSQPVYKIKGLSTMLDAGRRGEQNVINRMQAVESVRNLTRTVIMDADKETYDRITGKFQGIDGIVSKLEKQMVAVSGIPHNLLFSEAAGHSKSMFSTEGQSEWGEWETTVHSFRTNYLIKPLHRLYTLLFLNKGNGMSKANNLEKFKIIFSGQRKLSEDKEISMYESLLRADSLAVNEGFITPEEVRETRFSQGGTFSDYSIRIELDEAAFEAAKNEEEINKLAEQRGGKMAAGPSGVFGAEKPESPEKPDEPESLEKPEEDTELKASIPADPDEEKKKLEDSGKPPKHKTRFILK